MSNIRTTTEEFAVSGSLQDPQQKLTSTALDEGALVDKRSKYTEKPIVLYL